MTAPLDKLGQPVYVGSIIAYGHALGRCAGLRIGRVLALTQKAQRWYGPPENAPPPLWHATVIGVDDDWAHCPPALNAKIGTLMFPDRWIVLAPAMVPAEHRHLLESFVWPPLTRAARRSKVKA